MMARSKNAVKQLIEDISPGQSRAEQRSICIISSAVLKSESPTQVLVKERERTQVRTRARQDNLSYSAKHDQIFTRLFGKINIDQPGTGVRCMERGAAWSTVSVRGTR